MGETPGLIRAWFTHVSNSDFGSSVKDVRSESSAGGREPPRGQGPQSQRLKTSLDPLAIARIPHGRASLGGQRLEPSGRLGGFFILFSLYYFGKKLRGVF